LRILHLYKDYAPVVGGIENHVGVLARGAVAAGHEVTVLVTGTGDQAREAVMDGVRVIRARRLATVASTPLSLDLARRLAHERPHVTHLHIPYPVAEAAWLAVGRAPMVATYHSDVVRQRVLGRLWAPGLRRTLARAARVLATSPNYAESSPFLRAVRDHMTVVPLGIEPERFTQLDRGAARARFGDRPTLVFVGKLRYYKGLGVLIQALADLPGTQLLAVGSGPMGDRWRSEAAAAGVGERVRWLGEVPEADLRLALAAGDVFVLPAVARSEAYGTVLLEAMGAGLPLVTTELGTGTSWVNQHGRTGLVVPPNDVTALAAAVASLLADPARRAAMGAAGRARVTTELSQAAMIARVLTIYAEVAA
jgi:glycosyltransferase involved in cell wall biosynthesis